MVGLLVIGVLFALFGAILCIEIGVFYSRGADIGTKVLGSLGVLIGLLAFGLGCEMIGDALLLLGG